MYIKYRFSVLTYTCSTCTIYMYICILYIQVYVYDLHTRTCTCTNVCVLDPCVAYIQIDCIDVKDLQGRQELTTQLEGLDIRRCLTSLQVHVYTCIHVYMCTCMHSPSYIHEYIHSVCNLAIMLSVLYCNFPCIYVLTFVCEYIIVNPRCACAARVTVLGL